MNTAGFAVVELDFRRHALLVDEHFESYGADLGTIGPVIRLPDGCYGVVFHTPGDKAYSVRLR